MVLEIPGMDTPLYLETAVIPVPYTPQLGEDFRDFILEGVQQQLTEGGANASLWFLMPVTGMSIDVAHASGFIPVNDFMCSETSKDQFAYIIHHVLTKLEAFFTIFTSEVWMAEKCTQEERSKYTSLKDMPGVQEGLAVTWERRLPGGAVESHFWVYDIQRKEDGRVTLGERKEMTGASGRFASFLPPLESTTLN